MPDEKKTTPRPFVLYTENLTLGGVQYAMQILHDRGIKSYFVTEREQEPANG